MTISVTLNANERKKTSFNIRFDWVISINGALLTSGFVLDNYGHVHHYTEDTNFFTVWHGMIYSTLLLMIVGLTGYSVRKYQRGYRWGQLLPAGYKFLGWGLFLFAIGGIADMYWHTFLPPERTALEVIYHPPHFILMIAVFMVVSSPLYAAWLRKTNQSLMPAIVAACSVYTYVVFYSIFVHPFVELWPLLHPISGNHLEVLYFESAGHFAIVFESAARTGVMLLLLKRWPNTLPTGSFTLLSLAGGLTASCMHDNYIFMIVALLGGLFMDVTVKLIPNFTNNIVAIRAVSVLNGSFYWTLYFITLLTFNTPFDWPINTSISAIILAGVGSLGASYLVFPPTKPLQSIETQVE